MYVNNIEPEMFLPPGSESFNHNATRTTSSRSRSNNVNNNIVPVYTHNLVSRMQSFNFGGSQDAMILHDFSMKIVFRTHKFAVGPIDIESSESQGLIVSKL